jgi:hypothetical protein
MSVNVRVYLAAYMVAFQPANVFESMGDLEHSVFESAQPLVSAFHAIADAVAATGSFQGVAPALTANFTELLEEYLVRFQAWKVPDEVKLVTRIKHALAALYTAQPEAAADAGLAAELSAQIVRLSAKLTQIGGPDALALFEAERAGGGGAYAALPSRFPMSNAQLAHELLLDPTFQFDDSTAPGDPLHPRIRDEFHQAFWDNLADDMKLSPPCYDRVVTILAEIRDSIRDATGSDSINEVIDIYAIKRRLAAPTAIYDLDCFNALVESIVGAIKRAQSPHRIQGEWPAPIREQEQIGNSLKILMDHTVLLRVDACNSR